MTPARLIGLFLLPLAFAALPLAAMAVSATNDGGAEAPRIELAVPDQPADAGIEVDTLGFNAGHSSECGGGLEGVTAFIGS